MLRKFALNAIDMKASSPVPSPEMPYPSLLGQVIKAERGKLGMDQRTMATALGLSQSAYSRLESGEAVMNVWQVRLCARELGMAVGDLMKLVDRYEAQLTQHRIAIVAERKSNPGAALIGLAILAAVLASKG